MFCHILMSYFRLSIFLHINLWIFKKLTTALAHSVKSIQFWSFVLVIVSSSDSLPFSSNIFSHSIFNVLSLGFFHIIVPQNHFSLHLRILSLPYITTALSLFLYFSFTLSFLQACTSKISIFDFSLDPTYIFQLLCSYFLIPYTLTISLFCSFTLTSPF